MAKAGRIGRIEHYHFHRRGSRRVAGRGDEVSKWAKQYAAIFLPLDTDIQTEATKILDNHPTLVGLRKAKSGADPFVIAAAIVHG
ncbi:MAG TPA: DUF4411 family protein [Pirellulales bacterium]|nr:DUF4411 family protein [Pirellulales bacterium]